MDLLPLLEKYGIGGAVAAVLWRVLTWLGSKGTELLAMHKVYLVSTARQSRRQTLILKAQQRILREHGVILRQMQERWGQHEKKEPLPTAVPVPASSLRPFTGRPAIP